MMQTMKLSIIFLSNNDIVTPEGRILTQPTPWVKIHPSGAWSFEYMVWDIENWRNLCSALVTSLSVINNTFTPLCHSTIISENWTSRRVTIQTLDVQYILYAIVYPGPVFYHLARGVTISLFERKMIGNVLLYTLYTIQRKSLETL